MKLLRSWPDNVPDGRNHVVDDAEKLVLSNYDYRPLFDVDDDVLLLEWDIAVHREDVERFAEIANEDPSRIIVAPYRLYETTLNSYPLAKTPWCHRTSGNQHIQTNDPFCHWFGLGMIYLPRAIVLEFKEEFDVARWSFEGFNDNTLSAWHWRAKKTPVPVIWEVRPVHLHYTMAGL